MILFDYVAIICLIHTGLELFEDNGNDNLRLHTVLISTLWYAAIIL